MSPLLIRGLIDRTNKILINKINEAKREFQKNKASNVWLTFKIITKTKTKDTTMDNKRATTILNYLFNNKSDKKYIININVIYRRLDYS